MKKVWLNLLKSRANQTWDSGDKSLPLLSSMTVKTERARKKGWKPMIKTKVMPTWSFKISKKMQLTKILSRPMLETSFPWKVPF